MKEKKFPHTRKPLHGHRWGVGGFGSIEESTATGVYRAKQRDSCTEDWCALSLTSLKGLSAHPQGQVGTGS